MDIQEIEKDTQNLIANKLTNKKFIDKFTKSNIKKYLQELKKNKPENKSFIAGTEEFQRFNNHFEKTSDDLDIDKYIKRLETILEKYDYRKSIGSNNVLKIVDINDEGGKYILNKKKVNLPNDHGRTFKNNDMISLNRVINYILSEFKKSQGKPIPKSKIKKYLASILGLKEYNPDLNNKVNDVLNSISTQDRFYKINLIINAPENKKGKNKQHLILDAELIE